MKMLFVIVDFPLLFIDALSPSASTPATPSFLSTLTNNNNSSNNNNDDTTQPFSKRVAFMLQAIYDLKNNKHKASGGGATGADHAHHTKKAISSYLKKKGI